MKLSLSWLSEFIDITESDHDTIKEVITANSAEVETMENTGELLKNIVLSEIVKLEPHPEADKLQLATVNDGKEKIRVVCGGSNLREGMKIAFAHVGTVVKLGGQEFLELKPIKIRGVESTGMICASTEIGLEEMFPLKQEKEVVDLSHLNAPIGTKLDKALGLDDTVIDIDNHAITNRSDLFSHAGFAREFVANGLAKWKKNDKTFEIPKENAVPPMKVTVKEPELCPRYSAVYITGVEIKDSPAYIQTRLSACGIRPISNLVDITNYVMLELGMPLHAFDYDQLEGKQWVVRRSKQGEEVVTLDQQKHTLPDDVVIIDDGHDIVDLCGIMGGFQSGINEKTNKVWLHAPVFNKRLVRQAGKVLNHTSEASTRYEKGVDTELTMKGLTRAVELILECCPDAKVASSVLDIVSIPTESRTLTLRQASLDRLIGEVIPAKKTMGILDDLGFEVKENKEGFEVGVPSWRLQDANLEADLIEEVARIHGYDNIPFTLPVKSIKPIMRSPERVTEKRIRDELATDGFNEMYTFAFLGPELLQKSMMKVTESMIEVANPISSDMSLMRQSLLPRTLETIADNLRYRNNFRLFELSRVYHKKGDASNEWPELIMATVGEDFRALQGVVESFGWSLLPARNVEHHMHPGRVASIMLRGKQIGTLYEVHPKVLKNFDIKPRVVVADVKVQMIHDMHIDAIPKYEELPKYPAVQLDVSILIDRKELAEQFFKAIKQADQKLIESVELIDEYTGKNVANDKRALTYSITYRASDRTLTEDEVSAVHKQALEGLKKKGAVIRD